MPCEVGSLIFLFSSEEMETKKRLHNVNNIIKILGCRTWILEIEEKVSFPPPQLTKMYAFLNKLTLELGLVI